MKFEDVKVGMRVVPFQKSTGSKFDSCNHWNLAKENNQLYLYVVDIKDTHIIVLNERINGWPGNYYLAQDFEPYIEGDVKMKYKKEDLNSSMLFKIRDKGLSVLLDDKTNSKIFYIKEFIEKGKGSISTLKDHYDNNLKAILWGNCYPEYDIMAIKQLNNCSEVLHMVLNDKEPEEWDWVRVEKTEKETQLENLVAKLQCQLTEAQLELKEIRQK